MTVGKCKNCGGPLPLRHTKWCSKSCQMADNKPRNATYQKKVRPSAPPPIESKRRDARHDAEMHVLSRVGKLSDEFTNIERTLDDLGTNKRRGNGRGV